MRRSGGLTADPGGSPCFGREPLLAIAKHPLGGLTRLEAGMGKPEHDKSSPHERAAVLRERVYVTFTAIAVLIVLRHEHVEVRDAAGTLLIAVLGTITAGLLSEIISHGLVYQRRIEARDWRHMLSVAGAGLAVLVVPMAVLLLARVGAISLELSLRLGLLLLATSLAGFGFQAFRPIPVPPWRKVLGLAGLVAAAYGVVAIELLAHGSD